MLHTYLPGSAPIADKRAAVSVDFLEHLHLTGQTFKFYQVEALAPVPAPPTSVTSSPASGSGASSSSGFPATPNWDFSNIAYTPSSTSSQASASHARKAAKAPSVTRHQTTDFSHLPGMKIMTREGVDVTNAASRGSKTKEQRDHAHLMRIIKACDSCRAKKIRCDPSHKKRAAGTAPVAGSVIPQSQASTSSRNKRQKTLANPKPTPSTIPRPSPVAVLEDFSWDDFDASMAWANLDSLDPFALASDDWSEFMHFSDSMPGADEYGIENHAEFLHSQGFSPTSSFTTTTSTSSASSTKPQLPANVSAPDLGTSSLAAQDTLGSPLASNSVAVWTSAVSGSAMDYGSANATGQTHSVGVTGNDATIASAVTTVSSIDAGTAQTVLTSVDRAHSRERLDDPGTDLSSTASSASNDDDRILRSDIQAGPLPVNDTLHSRDLSSQQQSQPLLVTTPPDLHIPPSSVSVSDPMRAFQSVGSSDELFTRTSTATADTVYQTMAGIGDRPAGIPGLLPLSGPIVPGLAQLMLGGTSELLGTSPPLSSSTLLVTLCTAMAAMAAMAVSFMSSVERMLAVTARGRHHAQACVSQLQRGNQSQHPIASHGSICNQVMRSSALAIRPSLVMAI